MGHQILVSNCSKCKGLTGWLRKRRVFSDCNCNNKTKIMKQMEPSDFYNMNCVLNDSTLDGKTKRSQYLYWQKRVNERMDYLKPLINECNYKEMPLVSLSRELHQEWLELIDCAIRYNF